MSCHPLSPDTSVSEALAAARGAVAVFLSHRTACPGCYLARFCTLRDVATTYGLSLDALLEELEQVALAESAHSIGVSNDNQA